MRRDEMRWTGGNKNAKKNVVTKVQIKIPHEVQSRRYEEDTKMDLTTHRL